MNLLGHIQCALSHRIYPHNMTQKEQKQKYSITRIKWKANKKNGIQAERMKPKPYWELLRSVYRYTNVDTFVAHFSIFATMRYASTKCIEKNLSFALHTSYARAQHCYLSTQYARHDGKSNIRVD